MWLNVFAETKIDENRNHNKSLAFGPGQPKYGDTVRGIDFVRKRMGQYKCLEGYTIDGTIFNLSGERRAIGYLEIIVLQLKLSNRPPQILLHAWIHPRIGTDLHPQFFEFVSGGCEMVKEGHQ